MIAVLWLALAMAIGTNAQCSSCESKPLVAPIKYVLDRINDNVANLNCVSCTVDGVSDPFFGNPAKVFIQMTSYIKTAGGSLRPSTKIECNACSSSQTDIERRCPKLKAFTNLYIASSRDITDTSIGRMSSNATKQLLLSNCEEAMDGTVKIIQNKLQPLPPQNDGNKPDPCIAANCTQADKMALNDYDNKMNDARNNLFKNLVTILGAADESGPCLSIHLTKATRAMTKSFRSSGCINCKVVYDAPKSSTEIMEIDNAAESTENVALTVLYYIVLPIYLLLWAISRGLIYAVTLGRY